MKLPNQSIGVRAADNTTYEASIPASVSTEGVFKLKVPADLADIVQNRFQANKSKEWDADWKSTDRRNTTVITAATLAAAVQALQEAAAEFLASETETERFIVYRVEMAAAAWVEPDGTVLQNGYAKGATKQGRWHTFKTGPTLSANDTVTSYKVGIAAEVWDRTSYKRPSGTTYTWAHLSCGAFNQHHPADRLQNFAAIHLNPAQGNVKLMPYTDAAAEWFYQAMLSVARMACAMDRFFSDPDSLAAIQEGRNPMMALTAGARDIATTETPATLPTPP